MDRGARGRSATLNTVEATQAVRSPDRVRPFSARTGRIAAGAASGVLAAVVVRLAIGAGQVNYDSLYALVWGRDLAHGHLPDYAANVLPPTPHPLSTIAGILLAPLDAHATTGLLVASYLTLGAVGSWPSRSGATSPASSAASSRPP